MPRGERFQLKRALVRIPTALPALLLPVMPVSAGEILSRIGASKAAQDVRLDDTAWRASGEKRAVNEGPLWPRRDLEKGASLVTDTLNPPAAPPKRFTSRSKKLALAEEVEMA